MSLFEQHIDYQIVKYHSCSDNWRKRMAKIFDYWTHGYKIVVRFLNQVVIIFLNQGPFILLCFKILY